MKATYLLMISLATVSVSCTKDNHNEFPAATQEGKNTFGAYIDGKPFIAGSTLFGTIYPVNALYCSDATILYNKGFFSIGGIDARYSVVGIAGNIGINKLNVFGTGEYPLVDRAGYSTNFNLDGIFYYNEKSGKTYLAESGNLTITKLDTINRIVSGRFHFAAKDSLGTKVQITGGIFDAKYFTH